MCAPDFGDKSVFAIAKNGTYWHHMAQQLRECVCECCPARSRAPLSIPCSLHFPCKALVFSPCLLNELLLCGNWRSFCAANKELLGLSRLSSAPLSIFLPSFFFPCPPHYAPVSYLLCNVLRKDSSKRLFSIFGGGHVVASGFRRNLSIYWIGYPFLWCTISPFASITRLLQFQLDEAQFHNPSWPNMGKSRRIRFGLCSNPYPDPTQCLFCRPSVDVNQSPRRWGFLCWKYIILLVPIGTLTMENQLSTLWSTLRINKYTLDSYYNHNKQRFYWICTCCPSRLMTNDAHDTVVIFNF